MTFGEKIKILRQEKGITQQELSELSGVSLRTIINYEKHNRKPQKQNLYGIFANIFDVEIEYLFSDESDDYKKILTVKNSKKNNSAESILLSEIKRFFNNKNISDEEKESFFLKTEEAYWSFKLKHKK